MQRVAAIFALVPLWSGSAFGVTVRVELDAPRLGGLSGLAASAPAASVRPELSLARLSSLVASPAAPRPAPRPEKLPMMAVVEAAAQKTTQIAASLEARERRPAEDTASAGAAVFEAGHPASEIVAVSAVPTWEYDDREGIRPPADFSGAAPGCLILKASSGARFPPKLEFRGGTYSHLRNGFYIGAHATDRDIAGLFDVLAPEYEQREISVPFNLKVYRALADAALQARSGKPASKVLDFASGTGVGASALARAFPGAALYGFDLSPKMLALSAKRGLTPVGETDGRLHLSDGSVDVVTGAFILHLIRSPEWIKELARVMKPGASAAFNVYKPGKDWKRLYRGMFEAAGLEIVEVSETVLSMPVIVVRKP